ncbi:MAG: enoyl-CoA hydratase [Gemmatimonadaceae bacterium]
MSESEGQVRYERIGATANIWFDRPAARNAMTWTMYQQLATALEQLTADRGLRVAVLRGARGHFVAGTDISQFSTFASSDDGAAYERLLDGIVARLEAVPVPTVAVVEGYAAGGGLAIAAACDLRICTPDAKFGVPIAKTVGNCLSMANYTRLVMQLGAARTKALLFTADWLSAEEAHARDFVMEVVGPDQLTDRVEKLSAQLASHAPITLQVTKEAIRRMISTHTVDGDDLVRRAYGSRDFHEGVAAFVEKRSPRWEGR